ncbi:Dbp-1 [Ectropis obliqua nucleopolyhedrovirus]|uniref:Dbp-1 n=1 Tax=Ectropis obliqua nucleopolyhedrovirus TaxID=59376 RepID=A0EYR8_9ABAC|nr:Dbp-1 [Ectropis obliqua nucleopolyhedrovirus]ABI35699.1 Dbp-1 [Ectropis obliqua nucleopolyhedrovirus]AGS47880.1 putative 36.6 kDa protein [Ectropis obliqua nucleopolyhedrovirus]QWV59601.1 Dbp-1 [Ectropis obliqua nucleopolyhedrovirus]UYO72807.1 Dbp-1 [Ectropis obliqua nucleopolyhedrovirus]
MNLMHNFANEIEHDTMLCVFKNNVEKDVVRYYVWQEIFVQNLNSNKRFWRTSIKCDSYMNKFADIMAQSESMCLFDKNNFTGIVNPPRLMRNHYYVNSGGDKKPYYLFDKVVLSKGRNSFGDFVTVSMANFETVSYAFKSAIEMCINKKIVLQNLIYMSIPSANMAAMHNFVSKFFSVTRTNNEKIYTTGCIDENDVVKLQPMSVQSFSDVFNNQHQIEMVMCAIVEGVRQNKETINVRQLCRDSVSKSNTYVLAIKPLLFMHLH